MQTITGEDYSLVDDRVFSHKGCVVDVGCLDWDWSRVFLNKKRVIGIDPFENNTPEGAELFKGLLGSLNGKTNIKFDNLASSIHSHNENSEEFVVKNWKTFCKDYNIDEVSVLKINIEGAEYSLLNSLDSEDFSKIDQIAVSFHDWMNPNWANLTKSTIFLLESFGYEVRCIFERLGWYLAVKKDVMKKELVKNNTTIVTGLWDLERGDLNGWAHRDFSYYKERFFEMLKTDVQMCIWIPSDLLKEVEEIRKDKPTKIFIKENKDFETWNPFFDKIQKIRTDESWLSQADWLRESPQAALKYYNAMMFTKMFMVNDSAIVNPFDSEYFFWIDGGLTNTVSSGYFHYDQVLNNLENYMVSNHAKFMNITYPYTANSEIHGFERTAMAKYCNTDFVYYVARGGFFGGEKETIHKMNGLYYSILNSTLSENLMGADECIFTILCHQNPDLIHRFEIEGNGLVWPFFEELKKYQEKIEKPKPKKINGVGLYVITFNSPKQFETLLKSMEDYDPDFLNKTKKFLLDNSTDLSTTPKYLELCEKYNFEHIKKDNLGITGGRQWIAEHFHEQEDLEHYFFFEDDMFFVQNQDEVCRSGFNRYVDNLYEKALQIIKKENFDFLKLNFSEFYGTNEKQWAWYNVPQAFRKERWPEYCKLPEQGLDPNSPCLEFKNIKSHEGIPYATGEIYICNWPIVLSKQGNYNCYIKTKYAHPFEQTIMSHCYQELLKGNIKAGLLLITPTEHERFDFYEAKLRKEC